MDRVVPKEVLRRELRRRWLKVGGIVVAVGLASATLFIAMRKGIPAQSLQFSEVDRGSIELTIHTTGVVRPAIEEAVVSPIASRLLAVHHRNGDSVRAGDPLIQLDLETTQSQYDRQRDQLQMRIYEEEQLAAQSASLISNMSMQLRVMGMQIDQKRVELANARRLDSLGGGTAGTVREVELALRVAELEREQLTLKLDNERRIAQAQRNVKSLGVEVARKSLHEMGKVLSEAQIRAPRSGVLTFINAQVGSQISAGMQVATVADMTRFRIEGEMPDSYASRVSPGSAVTVRTGGHELEGTISSVAPTSKNGSMGFSVQLHDEQADGLRAGLKVELYVHTAKRSDVLRIANGSYYSKPGFYDLFVRQGRELHKRSVQLGESSYDHVEVISGLHEGEQVVTSDMSGYKEDTKLALR